MVKRTIAIIGAGPEIGMAVARRFGREGYNVGLVSRTQAKLDAYVAELGALGIEAAGFAGDVADRGGLAAAIAEIKRRFGSVDALEYSPLIVMKALTNVLDLDVDDAREHIEFQLYGAITSVRAVLPDMLAKGDGQIFLTSGASAIVPAPSHSNGSLGVTALRQYARMLHIQLRERGIYVGTICIGKVHKGEEIADMYWDMGLRRNECERLCGDPRYLAIYEELVAKGFANVYPPALKSPLPIPRNARERDVFLVSLYHIYQNRLAGLGDHADIAATLGQAKSLGGNPDAELFGVDINQVLPLPQVQ